MAKQLAGLDTRTHESPDEAVTVIDRGAALATAEVIERTKKIREVMEAVMLPNVHYGTIPGTGKPTMFQPGADVLAVTFRIAPTIKVISDLSTDDEVRYRITMQGVHQVTGEILAEGVGSCSSSEEKYKWRRPVVDQEWEETATDRRREKWQKGNKAPYQLKQIRTNPVDVENTVLKMAVKRAKIAMILNATAASDVFAQDLEDLSDELRESLTDDQPKAEPVQQPKRKEKPAPPPPESQPTEEIAPTGVVVADLERRRGQVTGVHYWIVRDHQGKFYFCPEEGDGWQGLVTALKSLKESGRRVEFETTQPDGHKHPTITAITPVPEP